MRRLGLDAVRRRPAGVLVSRLWREATVTYEIARAVLKVLAENGRDSQGEMVTVVVSSQISEAGQTAGNNMAGSFGTMTYDYTTDQLTFKPAKS